MVNLAATLLLSVARRITGGGVIINEHTVTREQLGFHVRVLRRWFDLIPLGELPRRLVQRAPRPFCVLTFDDGKRSNFSAAAPELERLGVPAVFCVTTEPLSSGSFFWFDRREQLVRALGYCPEGLELEALKQLPFDRLLERLNKAVAACRSPHSTNSDDLRPMTWDEVRSLRERGFTIGAHGETHAILTCETRKRAFAEIENSIARVTRETCAACTTFAFPNGSYNAELVQHALRCGVSTVMTTDPTWVNWDTPAWRLPRIQLFSGFSQTQIEMKLALAAIYGVLPNPNGSGRHYRSARRGRGAFAPSASSLRLG